MTLQPVAGPNNISNCVIVFPGGRFHLELRRSEFFDGHATLSIYESSLNKEALEGLKQILTSQDIEQLPAFAQPKPPFDPHGWSGFQGKIMRSGSVQAIGYFNWQGQEPRNSDSDKNNWKQSEVALKPLVEWFRAIKSFKNSNWRSLSRSKSTLCGEQ